jgi:hypothetical protein
MMRLALLLAAVAFAGTVASVAHAEARPLTASDRALLARAATYEEQIGEAVARRLTGHTVAVRCGPLGVSDPRILGVTPFSTSGPVDYFLMRPAECTYLAWFRQAPARWDPRGCASADCARVASIVMSLAVVAHESYHILGYRNEAQVECYGMQSIWFVANKLGGSIAESQALATYYANRMYPARQYNTPRYWSAECRDGGKYDLRRTLARWPS